MKDMYTTLEFNHILHKVKQYSVSSVTKSRIESLSTFTDYEALLIEQEFVKQAMYILQHHGRLPLSTFEDIEPFLQKANKDGVLFSEDFMYILQQLQNVKEVQGYIAEYEMKENRLVTYMKSVTTVPSLFQSIVKCIDSSGYVLDAASSELRRIRRTILTTEASIRTKIVQIQQSHKEWLSQETIATRNEHLVLPVKVGYKQKIKGIIHAISASGQTVFIEPDAIVQIHNQLVQLQEEEQQEIHRILLQLSKEVKEHYQILHDNQVVLLDLDSIFSKAQYGVSIDGCMPIVEKQYSTLVFKEARHPLISVSEVVSNDIVIDQGKRILLISGSNTGGKTVVLKTVGLLSVMALSGLPVSSYEACIPFFDDIFVDLGDEQSIEQSLSTFSSHMKRLVEITETVTDQSLVLLDEIGSGTDPQEGQSLAQAILQYLYQKKTLTVASTHYSGLKQFAKKEEYIIVAAVEFDQEKMRPTYRLLPGNVGNSYAIEISKRLGLCSDIIKEAHRIKEENMQESDRLLEKLQDELSSIQIEKDRLNELTKDTEKRIQKYEKMQASLEKEKDTIIKQAKQEANVLLEESKMLIDTVVEELRKNSELKPHVVTEAKRNVELMKHSEDKVTPIIENHEYQIGDIVQVVSANREGTVISINKKGILTIDMGGLKLTAKQNEVLFLRKKEKSKKVKTNVKSLQRTTKQGYELNVIGERYEEAMLRVDKFLDTALIQNYSMVRIIHGIGTGVLRNGVRKMLDKNKQVVSYRDGGPNEGGLGATLVYFE